MTAPQVQAHEVWLDGWNAGVVAAANLLERSDLPVNTADHAVEMVRGLLEDDDR